jgi:hypothetical protein
VLFCFSLRRHVHVLRQVGRLFAGDLAFVPGLARSTNAAAVESGARLSFSQSTTRGRTGATVPAGQDKVQGPGPAPMGTGRTQVSEDPR